MKTISEKELNLNEIILYKVSEKKDDNRMVVLTYKDCSKNPMILNEKEYAAFAKTAMPSNVTKLLNGEYEVKSYIVPELVSYSELNEQEIIKGMKQISKKTITKQGNIEVTYEDGTKITFPKGRENVISYISEKQSEIKLQENEIITNYENEKPSSKNSKKTSRKAFLAAALASVAVLTGSLLVNKSNNINKLGNEVFELYVPLNNNDRKANTKITELSEKLYNNIINNNDMGLLISDEIVKFDETLAYEITSFLNGVYPENLKDVDEATAKKEYGRVEQAILLIHSSNLDPETTNFVKLSDYVLDAKQAAVLNNAFAVSRYVVDEPKGEPMGTLILNSKGEKDKFTKEYNTALETLLNYEIDTQKIYDAENSTFEGLIPSLSWTTTTLFQTINSTIPVDSYVSRYSELRKVEADYPYRYYLDFTTGETWITIIEEETVKGETFDIVVYKNMTPNCEATILTWCEMKKYLEENPNLQRVGIEQDLIDIRAAVDEKALEPIKENAKGDLETAKQKAMFKKI